ncbi:hypothetical protein AO391_24955 [Pseudomonas marginalis ICMP 9505]|nr:hypothetical protein AO391_24955 [Pseudomonas marginalis ICMP 9505]
MFTLDAAPFIYRHFVQPHITYRFTSSYSRIGNYNTFKINRDDTFPSDHRLGAYIIYTTPEFFGKCAGSF